MIKEILPKAELVLMRELEVTLQLRDIGSPYLAIIGVDSEILNQELYDWLRNNIRVEVKTSENWQQLEDLLYEAEENDPQLFLFPWYSPFNRFDQLISNSLFHNRDVFFRKNLHAIVIVSNSLLQQLRIKAFDFVSVSSFVGEFHDQAANINLDLSTLPNPLLETNTYETLLQDWENYTQQSDTDAEIALQKLLQLAQHALAISKFKEAQQYFELAKEEATTQYYESKAFNGLGQVAYNRSQLEEAFVYFDRALQIALAQDNWEEQAENLRWLGMAHRAKSNLNSALSYYQDALTLYRRVGNQQGVARILSAIGLVYYDQSKNKQALDKFRAALGINKEFGTTTEIASNFGNMGNVYYDLSDYDKALQCAHHALELYQESAMRN